MTDRVRHCAAASDDARSASCPTRKAFRVQATEQGIRTALADMRVFLNTNGFDADACGTAEIVLAEALNNIAEHAFATTTAGTIRVTLTPGQSSLTAEIIDKGIALPGLCPPVGQLPPLGGTTRSLPEGGFGWFLIRTLTDCLSYTRIGGENHLCLRLALSRTDTGKVRSTG
jgi:serine/threonine-protein kinase RsbW